jgi:hypothetical protein
MEEKVLLDEEVFVFVAADGTPQSATVSEDYAGCIGIAELMSAHGFGMSATKMFAMGFNVVKARAKFVQIGTPEDAFETAKESL